MSPHPAKRKGDKAEREAAGILHNLLGVPARRKLGAGRHDNIGDLDGVPDTVVQVTADRDRGLVSKPRECEVQQARAGATFGFTMVRLRGGQWRIVMTVDQAATLWREAQPL